MLSSHVTMKNNLLRGLFGVSSPRPKVVRPAPQPTEPNENIDYEKIRGLSNIAMSGLTYGKPHTVGQASRISGVTYNDIGILIANISAFLEKK